MTLTSSQNPLLQSVRRAVESGRPLADGTIAAEGPHLLTEALKSRWQVQRIFCSVESLARHSGLLTNARMQQVDITEVSARAFRAVSDTEHDQGVLCLVRPPVFGWGDLLSVKGGPVVILDGIQDPGNAGTIVRSAEAFEAAGVVLTEGSVRVSNGKFLRAAAGSLFRLAFLENVARGEIAHKLGTAGLRLFSLAAQGRQSLLDIKFEDGFGIVVGNEGSGVSEAFLSASQTLSIPVHGVESLNAAVACSVALFEAARQRAVRDC